MGQQFHIQHWKAECCCCSLYFSHVNLMHLHLSEKVQQDDGPLLCGVVLNSPSSDSCWPEGSQLLNFFSFTIQHMFCQGMLFLVLNVGLATWKLTKVKGPSTGGGDWCLSILSMWALKNLNYEALFTRVTGVLYCNLNDCTGAWDPLNNWIFLILGKGWKILL